MTTPRSATVTDMNTTEHEQLLSTTEVMGRLSCGRTQLHVMVKRGTFPAPLKVGRMCRWRVADVDRWIAALAREAAAQAAPASDGGTETADGPASV